MNKQELIGYFIEQLGDNEILRKIMSIEKIREKLNYIIKDVTYEKAKTKGTIASWRLEKDGRGIVNFDISKLSKENERFVIVHELLHALSSQTIVLETSDEHNKNVEKVRIQNKVYRIL